MGIIQRFRNIIKLKVKLKFFAIRRPNLDLPVPIIPIKVIILLLLIFEWSKFFSFNIRVNYHINFFYTPYF